MTRPFRQYLIAVIVGMPFAVGAAFFLTDWLGWPLLIGGGVYWVGAWCRLTDPRK